MGTVVRKDACPLCRQEGRDSKGDNLYIYSDGYAYCHAGHGKVALSPEEKRVEHKVTVSDCLLNPMGHDPARMIFPTIYNAYGTRIAHDEESGKLKRIYYPYRNEAGAVTGVKVRIKDTKDFFVVGKLTGCFGAHLSEPNPKVPLIIVEGEEDALAMKQLLFSTVMKDYHVVSIPNGANVSGKVDSVIMDNLKFFQKYKGIILCMDNDDPGHATAKGLANWMSGFTDKLKIVKLPDDIKDASEYLTKGEDPSKLVEIIKNTPNYTPEGIISGTEISIHDIVRAIPMGYDTPFKGINEKLKGVRKSEILTVCAASGIGKSTLVTEIAYDLVVRHGLKVCHIALENVVAGVAATYIAMDNGVPASKFRCDPTCIDIRDVEVSMDKVVRKMFFFDHFGSIESSSFISKLMYYARSGIDFIILDHLSMVISGSEIQNERKEIDKIMTDLASMVVATGVGLINVVHLKRRETGSKDKGLNEGGQISLTDLRGSAALEQLSWGVIGLERNQQAEDGSEDFVYPRILKNRTWGFTGKAGRLRYDHKTGRLVDAPEETDEEQVPITPPEEGSTESEKSGSETLEDFLAGLSFSEQKETVKS